jgi:hypothetical protein
MRLERNEPDKLDVAKAARLRLALTAEGEQLFGVLQERDTDDIKAALKNPRLTEEHLLALLKRRDLNEQLMRSLQRLPRVAGSRRLKLALAGHPSTPSPLLATLLPQLFLFELVTLMQLPGAGEDQKVAAERAILKRLPETELGNKLTLARRGSPAILEALIKEGKPALNEVVLANPKLKESAIFAFVTSPAANAETISQVARHPKWGQRPNLRFAMLRNRKTPLVWFILFLPTLRKLDLEALAGSKALTPEQLAEVREEVQKRGKSPRPPGEG